MGASTLKFGILLRPDRPIMDLVRIYKFAEESGVQYAWVPDQAPSGPYRDLFAVLTAIGFGTRCIKLGCNIAVPYTRHPALLAYYMKSLDELFPRRQVLGLGPGGVLALKPLGIPMWRQPVTAMREAVKICRALFEGEKVTFHGRIFSLYETRLYSKPSSHIPILLGCRGPNMLRLAGEIADGASCTLPLKAVKAAVQLIKEGANKTKRSLKRFEIANHLAFSVDRDGDKAREAVKKEIIPGIVYANEMTHTLTGIDLSKVEKLKKALVHGWHAPSKIVTDEMVEHYAVAGTPDEVITKIKNYEKEGVKIFDFMTPIGPALSAGLQLIKDCVIPAFRK
ncbi:MAG: LLM class flavin-dependent oxidoreductase [Candidatus Ranarchaeia archaeon]